MSYETAALLALVLIEANGALVTGFLDRVLEEGVMGTLFMHKATCIFVDVEFIGLLSCFYRAR